MKKLHKKTSTCRKSEKNDAEKNDARTRTCLAIFEKGFPQSRSSAEIHRRNINWASDEKQPFFVGHLHCRKSHSFKNLEMTNYPAARCNINLKIGYFST